MGLPSKKQLNKHKRGARKAFDTLDALNEEQPETAADGKAAAKPKKSAESTKSKKKKPAKSSPKKKQEKKPVDNKAEDAASIHEDDTVHIEEEVHEQIEPPKEEPIELESKSEKIEIVDKEEKKEAEMIELEPTDNSPVKPSVDHKEQDRTPQEHVRSPKVVKSEAATEATGIESSQFTNVEEDTQKDRYLSFRIAKEDYGIEIRFVTEIIVMQKITEVPNTPSFIRGVINLRGKVIPVMDVRERFHLELREYDERTCIVVVDVSDVAVGLIVDTVNEVVDIPDELIDPPPATYTGIKSNYISGMGKIGKSVKILLDVKNILDLK